MPQQIDDEVEALLYKIKEIQGAQSVLYDRELTPVDEIQDMNTLIGKLQADLSALLTKPSVPAINPARRTAIVNAANALEHARMASAAASAVLAAATELAKA